MNNERNKESKKNITGIVPNFYDLQLDFAKCLYQKYSFEEKFLLDDLVNFFLSSNQKNVKCQQTGGTILLQKRLLEVCQIFVQNGILIMNTPKINTPKETENHTNAKNNNLNFLGLSFSAKYSISVYWTKIFEKLFGYQFNQNDNTKMIPETTRLNKTIAMISYLTLNELQKGFDTRDQISSNCGFPKQRICVVLSILKGMGFVSESKKKRGVLIYNEKQIDVITNFCQYKNYVLKLRRRRRELCKKGDQLLKRLNKQIKSQKTNSRKNNSYQRFESLNKKLKKFLLQEEKYVIDLKDENLITPKLKEQKPIINNVNNSRYKKKKTTTTKKKKLEHNSKNLKSKIKKIKINQKPKIQTTIKSQGNIIIKNNPKLLSQKTIEENNTFEAPKIKKNYPNHHMMTVPVPAQLPSIQMPAQEMKIKKEQQSNPFIDFLHNNHNQNQNKNKKFIQQQNHQPQRKQKQRQLQQQKQFEQQKQFQQLQFQQFQFQQLQQFQQFQQQKFQQQQKHKQNDIKNLNSKNDHQLKNNDKKNNTIKPTQYGWRNPYTNTQDYRFSSSIDKNQNIEEKIEMLKFRNTPSPFFYNGISPTPYFNYSPFPSVLNPTPNQGFDPMFFRTPSPMATKAMDLALLINQNNTTPTPTPMFINRNTNFTPNLSATKNTSQRQPIKFQNEGTQVSDLLQQQLIRINHQQELQKQQQQLFFQKRQQQQQELQLKQQLSSFKKTHKNKDTQQNITLQKKTNSNNNTTTNPNTTTYINTNTATNIQIKPNIDSEKVHPKFIPQLSEEWFN
ncbi:squamosa promoter-binding-like protein [Anaeramoeba flamelloides]|uniref:Squamosa promoter-binding-like protein n=1 Tax=Anaeramoeba flamelloides TaxID=1746091 RepID=A0ABQ8YKH2_9EUKA|nr:squamosa promoter-binding-like protein [Anaeramoeba flamelloides]